MDKGIIEKIKKEIQNFAPSAKKEGAGIVSFVGDGVAEIEGLQDVKLGEMLVFDTASDKALEEALDSEPVYGLALNLEEESVKAVILGEASAVKEGMTVKPAGKLLSVPAGEALLGRVLDTLGNPIDGKGPIKSDTFMALERDAYPVLDRQSVNEPLHTGIKAIDAMIPIGRGQRELIIGDRFTGKTTIAIDTIINQKYEPEGKRPVCIYVAVGQKESKTARIVAKLQEEGAMDYTIVVSAPASASATLQYLAPYAGVAMAEYFMDRGQDALIIYDDLSKQAVAYRQVSLLLRRPPGREAYPGDIFYLHSRLLERAAKLSEKKGGGSITALPIIETQEGDVSAYIPTNVISITDGQIFLDASLFNKGLRPAIDVGNSVSRVGSSAQTKAMKKVGGSVRIELAQFRELEAFAQFAQDLDEATKERLDRGARMAELLKQNKNEPMPFYLQAIVMFAGNAGLFLALELDKVNLAEKKWLQFVEANYNKTLERIKEEKAISETSEEELKQAMEDFKAANADLFE